MPESARQTRTRRAPKRSARPSGEERGGSRGWNYRRLLRQSHIFASAFREVLEVKVLDEVSPLPLSVGQFHLLKLMTLNGRHQVGEIADFLGVSAPAAVKNIDKLERLGLVVRSSSEGDRRATFLAVSPKGRRLVRRFEERKAERLSPVLESFKPQELETLTDFLERFALSLLSIKQMAHGSCLRCAAYLDAGCAVGRIRGGCPFTKLHRPQAGSLQAGET